MVRRSPGSMNRLNRTGTPWAPGGADRPTGRNILATFQGLGATYTPRGLRLDRLTHTQRAILNHLNIALPWPEQAEDETRRSTENEASWSSAATNPCTATAMSAASPGCPPSAHAWR